MHPAGQVIFQQMPGQQKYSDDNADKDIADQKSDHKFCHIKFLLFDFWKEESGVHLCQLLTICHCQ